MLCFRLISESSPAEPLANAVAKLREGNAPKDLYAVEPASFQQIPNAPFAYWVSEHLRRLFAKYPSFENDNRTLRQGLASADDFRFIRTAWEKPSNLNFIPSKWCPFAKGGSYSPYYSSIHLYVNWFERGSEIKNNRNAQGALRSNVWMLGDTETDYFLRPGITWPRRTSGLSFRILPRDSIFADKGPAAFVNNDSIDHVLCLLGISNSAVFNVVMGMQLARVELAQSFEVGLVKNMPIPEVQHESLAHITRSAWSTKRRTDTATLTSHAFHAPALAPGRKSHTR